MKKGKKLLAMLSVLAILVTTMVSSLALPLVSSAGEVQTKADPSASFANFATQSGYSVYSYCTIGTYDATQGAMKVVPTTASGAASSFDFRFSGKQATAGHLVMAALVKLADPEKSALATGTLYGGTNGSLQTTGTWTAGGASALANFSDWQLMIFTAEYNNSMKDHTANGTTAVWDRFAIRPFGAAGTVFEGVNAADLTYWVKWAGVFASEDAAYEYADMEKPVPNVDRVMDFSAEPFVGVDTFVSNSYWPTVSDRGYDATQQAYKIVPKNTGTPEAPVYNHQSYELFPKFKDKPSVAGYLTAAALVKLGDVSLANSTPFFGGYTENAKAASSAGTLVKGYNATTDWQLIIFSFDATAYAFQDATAGTPAVWQQLDMRLNNNVTPTAAHPIWVKWAGVFESEDAVYEYANMEKPVQEVVRVMDFSTATPTGFDNFVSAGIWAEFSDRGYDATEQAYKIVPKNIGTAGEPVYKDQSYEFFPKFKDKASVDGYRIAAAWVKLGDVSLASYAPVTYGHTKTPADAKAYGRMLKGYTATTDWQLIVFEFDASEAAFADGALWDMLDMRLNGNVAPTAAHPMWVKWAGAFESEAAAYIYAGLTPPPSEDGPVAPNTPAILVDTSKQTPEGGSLSANDPSRTEIAYDATEQAWLVKPTETAPFKGAQLAINFKNQKREVDSYRTIAAWVKLNKPDTSGGRAILGTKNDRWTANTFYDAATPETTYTYSTEYQLVIWNAEGLQGETLTPADPNVPVAWAGVILEMLQNGATPTQDDKFWVKWVGVFASEDDAYGYAGVEKPESNENTSGVTPVTMIDFSKNMAGGATPIDGNTKIEYDTTQMALKVSPLDGSKPKACNVQLRYSPKVAVDGTDNKVYAALVKTADPDAMAGGFLGGTENDQATGTFTVGGGYNYNGTSEWQLIVYDDRQSSSLGYVSEEGKEAALFVVQLRLLDQSMAPENELPVWVKWHGIFTSVEDAYKYAGMEMPAPDPDAKTPPSNFFYDYTKRMVSGVSAYAGSNTTFKYDKQEKALKVFPAEYGQAGGGYIQYNYGAKDVSTKDYPVFAMYMKIPDSTIRFSNFIAGTRSKYSATFMSSPPTKGYAKTTDYQLVIFDGTNFDEVQDAFSGTWAGALINMLYPGTVLEEGQAIYIKWAGAFPSVQAVYDYAGEVYVEEYVEPNQNGPSPFFWDLDNWDVIKFHVGEGTDTDAAYSDREDAMSVTAINYDNEGALAETAGTITLGIQSRIKQELNAKDYPYVALRIKLGRADMVGSWAKYRTSHTVSEYQNDNLESADMDFAMLEYTPSTEWQTIVIDCASGFAAYSFDGTWIGLTLSLFDSLYTLEEDVMYIKWAGAFKSIDDIKAYMKKTEGTEDFAPIETPDEEGDGSYEDDEGYDDEEYGDEYIEDDADGDEPDDTTSDSDSSTKKTSKKKVYRTKKVAKNQAESSFPILYVGIGIAVLAVAGLVIFFIVRKKRTTQEKPE